MRTLDYQTRVLETLDAYLDALKVSKAEADEIEEVRASKPHLKIEPLDYPKAAWDALKGAGRLPASRMGVPYTSHQDGAGRAVPNATLKVPTGGGKTWLAVNAVSRIMGRYLGRNAGFVLWIVPNEAIYSQTLARLKDRQHPYRQALDRAAAGRVKVMEKGDGLHVADVESHLCVMVLMLQASNRATKEQLRMFRDRGDVHGFFPPEGEQQAHAEHFRRTPNLDGYDHDFFPMVKDSLGNALRLIQPVIVVDEGQKATSDLAYETLYGFNPLFVLELTATPKDVAANGARPARNANVLVEILGRDLDAEEMIKMPLNLDPRQGTDWRNTLQAALDKLFELERAADGLRGERGRYIRPIMLVQVERTGKETRDGNLVHAEDVKDWLLKTGFDQAEVAIKTADQNDLAQPENMDLLSATNRVRVIITKAALQEGWDCPFAYVLCSLAAGSSLQATTQLVGRILRQPGASKTGIAALDECYVYTHHARTGDVVGAVKKGLEQDGLADLVLHLPGGDSGGQSSAARPVERRTEFRKVAIYLPKVLHADGGGMRDLDYEADLLACLDWRDYDPARVIKDMPENPMETAAQLQRISLARTGDELITGETVAPSPEAMRFDPSYAVRVISDLVPNPFVGRQIVADLLSGLAKRGFSDDKIGRHAGVIIEELRKDISAERDRRAEGLFRDKVANGQIQFRLRMDGDNWQMPETMETTHPVGSPVLTGADGNPVGRSLFAPFFSADLNKDERNVAVMLDGTTAIEWWHRNVAMPRAGYGLQGWKRGRIYPDFIFAVRSDGAGRRLVALETKGDHLQNPDTDYKRAVLSFLTDSFDWDSAVPAGQLALERRDDTVECALILMQDINAQLPQYVAERV